MLFMKSTWHVKILNCKIRILVSHLHVIKFSFFYADIKKHFQNGGRLIHQDLQYIYFIYLTVRPRIGMDYESIAHEAVGRVGYSNS